jgi:hypothetical protein
MNGKKMEKRTKLFSSSLKEVKVVNLCASIAGSAAISASYQMTVLGNYAHGASKDSEILSIIQVVFLLFLVILYSNFNYRYLVKNKTITSKRSDIIQLTITPLVFIALAFIVANLVITYFY